MALFAASLQHGCIGSPPASRGDASAPDGASATRDGDGPGEMGGVPIEDVGADGGVDDMRPPSDVNGDLNSLPDLSAPDMPEPEFVPLDSFDVAFVTPGGLATLPTDSFIRVAHLRFGLNANVTAQTPTTAAAGDFDLVVVAWTAQESTPFSDAEMAVLSYEPTPVVVFPSTRWNELAIAAGAGLSNTLQSAEIVLSNDARSAGLPTGAFDVYLTTGYRQEGRDVYGPDVVPVVDSTGANHVYFTYETGSTMITTDGRVQMAPARRVGFGFRTLSQSTRAGWRLLGAAYDWALERSITATSSCALVRGPALAPLHHILAARLALHGCDVRIVASAQVASIADADLIIVGPEASEETVGQQLAATAVPVVFLMTEIDAVRGAGLTEAATSTVETTAEWVLTGQSAFLRGGNPAGLTMVTDAASAFTSVPLSSLVDQSDVIAVAADGPDNDMFLWAFEANARLPGGAATAPARRVVISTAENDRVPTDAYESLFDAAIQWALLSN